MNKIGAALFATAALILETSFLILARINNTPFREQVDPIAFVLFPLVGAVLIARHPRNPVGYLVSLLGMAVLGAVTLFEYGMVAHQPNAVQLPLTGVAAWLSSLLWSVTLPCLVLILLLFPDGRLIHSRLKWLARFVIAVTLPVLVFGMIATWPFRNALVLMDSGRIPYSPEMERVNELYNLWSLLLIVAIILALVSFFVRFSRARGIERQQLKWFVFGLSTIPASLIIERIISPINLPLLNSVQHLLNFVSIAAFPVLLLIAMTRYRLYDIDFIIRRTLLYSALTITLAGIYFGAVLLMQSIFTRRMEEPSEIFVVFSTLLIAALFQPLRRRFQTIIDKRFYRSKYDTEETLAQFATRLQNEVDLDEIQRTFVRMVDENIQPEGTALWLVKR